MDCPNCKIEMEKVDYTESNITTKRAKFGQHTGDIYWCEKCGCKWLDNLLTGEFEIWVG